MRQSTSKKMEKTLKEEKNMSSLQENYKVESDPYTVDDLYKNVLGNYNFEKDIVPALKSYGAILFTGASGTGKSNFAKNLGYTIIGFRNSYRILHLSFSQATYYTDLIEGIVPDGNGGFEYKKGSIMKFCEKALKEPDKSFVIIIDEINKANIDEALGEIITCLADRKIKISTNQGNTFCIPDNIIVIATMNNFESSIIANNNNVYERFYKMNLNKKECTKFLPTAEQIAKNKNLDESTTKALIFVKDKLDKINSILIKDINIGINNIVGVRAFFAKYDSIYELSFMFRDIVESIENKWEMLRNDDKQNIEEIINDVFEYFKKNIEKWIKL